MKRVILYLVAIYTFELAWLTRSSRGQGDTHFPRRTYGCCMELSRLSSLLRVQALKIFIIIWHLETHEASLVNLHQREVNKFFIQVLACKCGISSCKNKSWHSVASRQFKWKKIWMLPVLPKVRQFIWRLVHNSLPLMRNIHRRIGPTDTLCLVCKRFDEDGGHCFLKCKPMRRCWLVLGVNYLREELLESRSSSEMVTKILSLEEETCIKVLCLLWK